MLIWKRFFCFEYFTTVSLMCWKPDGKFWRVLWKPWNPSKLIRKHDCNCGRINVLRICKAIWTHSMCFKSKWNAKNPRKLLVSFCTFSKGSVRFEFSASWRGFCYFFWLFKARDRHVAESNYTLVNFWSLCHMVAMVATGLIQVVMVRSLFDEKSVVRCIWKQVHWRRRALDTRLLVFFSRVSVCVFPPVSTHSSAPPPSAIDQPKRRRVPLVLWRQYPSPVDPIHERGTFRAAHNPLGFQVLCRAPFRFGFSSVFRPAVLLPLSLVSGPTMNE